MPMAVRMVGALIAFSAACIPPLISHSAAEEAAECQRRRGVVKTAHTRLPDENWWRVRSCPRDGEAFQFAVGADGKVEVVCPRGHGRQSLRMHSWFSVL